MPNQKNIDLFPMNKREMSSFSDSNKLNTYNESTGENEIE
jgi:hypothetical protein